MADSQPPEGLRKIVSEAVENAPCVHAIAYFREHGVMTDSCSDCVADAVLEALFEACEVREEVRPMVNEGVTYDFDSIVALWVDGPAEHRFVITTPPEPVSSTGEEKTDGN